MAKSPTTTKETTDPKDAGAAAPTADDSADKPANDVINTTPDPEVAPADQGHVNTTGNSPAEVPGGGQPRTRDLTDADKDEIFSEFNAGGSSVQAVADKWEVTPEEVFAIVDSRNEGRED